MPPKKVGVVVGSDGATVPPSGESAPTLDPKAASSSPKGMEEEDVFGDMIIESAMDVEVSDLGDAETNTTQQDSLFVFSAHS